MTASTTPDHPIHWAPAFVLTLIAYTVTGLLALVLAIPPGYATPLYPAAGVALASVLLIGWRMLPAVALGAFCVNLALALRHAPFDVSMLLLPSMVATGATLQALLGAWLVRRNLPHPITLLEPRDIVVFLTAAMVSCLVNTSISNIGLWLTGTLDATAVPFSVAAWWVGDLLGVLIATPVLLTLLGLPREVWAPRRLSVGLTLTLVTLVLSVALQRIGSWNIERTHDVFERDATNASLALVTQLRDPLQALEALHGAFLVADRMSPERLRLVTEPWLEAVRLQAIGWAERVARAEVPAFEARVRSEGYTRYSVFDRVDGGRSDARDEDDILAIHYIEPQAGNTGALGVNVLSIQAARDAIERTRQTGRPAASAGFRLTQQPANGNLGGIVVYQAVHRPPLQAPGQSDAELRGVVFVTLQMDQQLQALTERIPSHLALCLVDVTEDEAQEVLAGAPGCESGRPQLQHVQGFAFAGRRWEVRASPLPGTAPIAHNADVWLFALVGLLSTAMLGGFLLALTGRTRRIETAVHDRTTALQAQVRERLVAEAALRESEQRFRNILNHVPIGVIYTDLRGNVKQANPRFCELTGYSEPELLLMGLSDYTHADDLEQDIDLMAQLVRGDIPVFRRHKRYIAKHGATVWVQATVSLLRGANHKPRSVVGVVEDITEHLKLEEAERAREAAEASNRAKSEFLSRMSHELRTPLNAMLGFAQLLELDTRHPLVPAQQPWVSQIQQAGWHLLEMINDVLDLSRIESGNLLMKEEPLNLAELLDVTLSMVIGEANKRQIRISQDFAHGTSGAIGDATRVKQILINLLSNAVKYNADGGRIHITGRSRGAGKVEIAVTDTGLGMTPQQLGELFQPFNRLGRERSAQQGTGIGLVISQRLAELMGGSLTARSTPGDGSTFTLTLPCSVDPDTVRSDLDEVASDTADYHRRRIHYVEDNETNVEVMRGILAQRPQIELHVSINGFDGMAAIRSQPPDLILLDMHLPDISGMEILLLLKADPDTRSIPVVVVSADALAEQIDAAYAAGCSHYLTKPVSISELLGVVDTLLEQMDTQFG